PTYPECDETLFFHQSSDSIFLYNDKLSFLPEWRLVFRNNFMVGDSFQTDNEVTFIVQSIDTVQSEGQTIRWFNLIDIHGYHHRTISDLFGPYLGFFDADMGLIADSHEYYLRCYESPESPLTHISTEQCDQVLHPQSPTQSLLIIPNPAHDVINLNFKGIWTNPNVQITFWDEIGRLVLTEDVTADNQDMDISALPSGVYFVVSQSGSFSLRQKLVKV
ncbi:MAG: T9SS type A sorting domain-containing protein, partial [Saprospiraceae bacterium]|nr:T9SS type A sorting domain-containing protein [Saprospiraceae bacterium]